MASQEPIFHMPQGTPQEAKHLRALSILTLTEPTATKVNGGSKSVPDVSEALEHVASLDQRGRDEFLALADAHHVVVRAMQALTGLAAGAGNTDVIQWASEALARENARIENALKYLDNIVRELDAAGCRVTVIKSLDHWPDVGNDLDLYSPADEKQIVRVMVEKFKARVEPRSWGDRLANKWNFSIEGLRELIEVHSQRLGQTGEHRAIAERVVQRSVKRLLAGYCFPVPAPEERIIVATLQRMYRHFYFRICDIVNTANVVETDRIDFGELRRAADLGGIWPGVATYLVIASDYVKQYRGTGLELPKEVRSAARFGGSKITVRQKFLRVPILAGGAGLYTSQVTQTALRGDLPGTLRLSLLPYLASAAAVAAKVTGSDKGIW
jgi:putative nucleotidyltransferase-like protein